MKKKYIGALLVALLLGGIVLIFINDHRNEFLYAGTLETDKTIVSAKVASDLVYNPLHEGDWIKQGDVIVKLNDDIYQVAAKQLNAEYQRFTKLYQQAAISREALDNVERQKLENDLKLEWCVVRAPLDGLVITVYRELGEYVNSGAALVAIANPYETWAYFYLPYDKIHQLQVGSTVWGSLQELPSQKFKGTILKINEEAEFTPKNVQTRKERTRLIYGVKVRFDNGDLLLKAGMTMEAKF